MSYIGQQLPADVFSGFTTDTFAGDGSATTFTLSKAPFSENGLIVVINNVIQKPTTNFTVSGTTLTIVGTAVASGDVIYATHLSGVIPSTLASKLDTNGVSDALILDADADTTISADTDDQIDFKAGGTDIMSLTATTAQINDGLTVTVSDNTDNLTLISTDTDANYGPNIELSRPVTGATNDFLGRIDFSGQDAANNTHNYFSIEAIIGDATSGGEDGRMLMRVEKDGSTINIFDINGTEVVINEDSVDYDLRVEGNGDANALFVQGSNDHVGIGTNSPGHKLQVDDNVADVILRVNNLKTSGGIYGQLINFSYAPDDNDNHFFYVADTVANRMFILSDGDIKNHDNSYGSISDERIKQDIRDSNSQWDDIKAVKVRNYKKKDDVRQYGDKAWEQIGVIAQELEDAGMDKLVKESDPTSADILSDSSFGTLYEDGDTIPEGKKIGDVKEVKQKIKGVSYSVLYMKAIKALQEAMAKIETLETKVKTLEDA